MKTLGARDVDRAGVSLAVASVVNGLAALVFIRVGNQAYGVAGFAPISIVWSVWSVTVAVLTFPVQHWTIREMRRRGNDGVVQTTIARLVAIVSGVGVAVTGAAFLIGPGVLRTSSWVSPVTMGILVIAALPIGYVRGRLVAEDRYLAASWTVGGENLIRLLGAMVVVGLGLSADAYLATLALGPLVLVSFPHLLRLRRTGDQALSVRDMVELSGANSLAQLALAGGPILLAVLGAPDRQVSATFNTMSLARAPYLVLLGASMRLTALWSGEGGDRVTRPRIAWVTAALAVAATLVGAVVGPPIVAAVFGSGTALSGVATAAVAAGSTLALGTLVMASRYTSDDDTSGLSRAWAIASLVGVVGLAVPATPLVRVLTWFVVTELVALALLGSRSVTPRRRRE